MPSSAFPFGHQDKVGDQPNKNISADREAHVDRRNFEPFLSSKSGGKRALEVVLLHTHTHTLAASSFSRARQQKPVLKEHQFQHQLEHF